LTAPVGADRVGNLLRLLYQKFPRSEGYECKVSSDGNFVDEKELLPPEVIASNPRLTFHWREKCWKCGKMYQATNAESTCQECG
jgi:hypothetical protein